MIPICIVTYNRLSYLQKCVWSIIASTKKPYEIYVIDDCSTDGTKDWLLEMRERKKIKALSLNKNPMGTANNFNHIIKATTEDWVVLLNDDMYLHRGWDEACLDIIKGYKDCGIVSFYDYTQKGENEEIKPVSDKAQTRIRTGLGAVFMYKKLYSHLGGYKLAKGRRMGYFASNFCYEAYRSNFKKRILYETTPNYATHMDYHGCALNELDKMKKYILHRSKHKNRGR